jgi:plasmid stabilization system protein ParE
MKVLWTLEALERLFEIENFIAQDSPKRARQFVGALIERGDSLSENPRRGRPVPEISNPRIRELIIKNYRIVYRLRRDQIEILTVFEGHRQLGIDDLEE